MSWIETSYMGRRGVAKGARGATHALTEAVQGEYNYVYGPYAEPVLRIRPGDVVAAETHDAFDGRHQDARSDLPSKVLTMPFVNPQNGPDRGRGREEGRRAGRPHPLHPAARTAAGGHHGADPGVRRPRRHAHHRHAQRAAGREGQEDGGDRRRA